MTKLTLRENFSEEQKVLAKKLSDTARYEAEIFNSCEVAVYGLIEREGGDNSILFEFVYADPEETGELTIFCSY